MSKAREPHERKCYSCGTKVKYKLVNRVWWVDKPFSLQPYCPKCKKIIAPKDRIGYC
ncbi:MAG: hypothetical protein IAX21_04630 [Candidatus Bathyarchaeota archaeon]|nr:MAG: hypothetical protein IAX21_04630 [Candidatus Bathyarchaeota archaeon]